MNLASKKPSPRVNSQSPLLSGINNCEINYLPICCRQMMKQLSPFIKTHLDARGRGPRQWSDTWADYCYVLADPFESNRRIVTTTRTGRLVSCQIALPNPINQNHRAHSAQKSNKSTPVVVVRARTHTKQQRTCRNINLRVVTQHIITLFFSKSVLNPNRKTKRLFRKEVEEAPKSKSDLIFPPIRKRALFGKKSSKLIVFFSEFNP